MKPVMRYHGAKFRLASWIMQFFPEHTTYVEPFGGSAGVLMQKPRCYAEIYNDLDGDTVNVFRVLQDPKQCAELKRRLIVTPYARAEFELAYQDCLDPVDRARRTLVRAHMGFGSAGATKGNTGFRIDMMRAYGTASHLWAEYPESIASFCDRLQGVLLECRPAIEVMRQYDSPQTLHYVDPPYMMDTRVWRDNGCYRHEMTNEQHQELLAAILELEGFVVVSGYETDLYSDALEGWEVHRTGSRISAGRGTAVRTECAWLNPRCAEQQRQQQLFGGTA